VKILSDLMKVIGTPSMGDNSKQHLNALLVAENNNFAESLTDMALGQDSSSRGVDNQTADSESQAASRRVSQADEKVHIAGANEPHHEVRDTADVEKGSIPSSLRGDPDLVCRPPVLAIMLTLIGNLGW
jgi:hypothetical protein